MIKKAYMQGEVEVEDSENEEEDGGNGEDGAASPRNVGHNIYILAHQVPALLGLPADMPPTHFPFPTIPGAGWCPQWGSRVPGAAWPVCRVWDTSVFPLHWGHVPGNPLPPRASPLGRGTWGEGCVWRRWREPRACCECQ